MRFVNTEESKKEYKEFLEKHNRCNFQQSLEWAEVKKPNWKPEVILAEDEEGKIIGSLCVWIRKMPIFGNIMYASRGPVCDIHDIAVMKQLTDGAKELAKKYNAIVLRIEPDILSNDQDFRDIVSNLGYKIKDDAKDFKDEIQPRYVFRLDIKGKTEEEVMAGFKQKWRYNIRLAGKKGVVVKEIIPLEQNGQVKVAGQLWSAITNDESQISINEIIKVIKVDGVKLVVTKDNENV